MKRKILLIGSLPSSLINFRGSLLKEMVLSGHEVHVALKATEGGSVLLPTQQVPFGGHLAIFGQALLGSGYVYASAFIGQVTEFDLGTWPVGPLLLPSGNGDV